MCNAVMNMHEGFNTLQKPVNIKASASLIIHIWSQDKSICKFLGASKSRNKTKQSTCNCKFAHLSTCLTSVQTQYIYLGLICIFQYC